MTSHYETMRGEVRETLRAATARSDVDGLWQEQKPQSILVERKIRILNDFYTSLSVAVSAFRSVTAGTTYTVSAIETADQRIITELPPYVEATIRAQALNFNDSENLAVLRVGDGESVEQLLVADAVFDEETRYRQEKTLVYTLDEQASLLSWERSQHYSSLEDDDEDGIRNDSYIQLLRPEEAERDVLSDAKLLAEDSEFVDYIRGHVSAEQKSSTTQLQGLGDVAMLLSFLKFNGNSSEVRKLIWFS